MTSSEPGSNEFGQGAVETFSQFCQGGSLEVLFFDNPTTLLPCLLTSVMPHELLDLDSCE